MRGNASDVCVCDFIVIDMTRNLSQDKFIQMGLQQRAKVKIDWLKLSHRQHVHVLIILEV